MATEVIHHSWGNRLMNSLKNIVFGIVVFVLGMGLLWWNEQRAVRDYKEINDVWNQVRSIPADTVSPGNDGKIVHLSGKAATQAVLKDPLYEVEANAIRLRRKVEMYQWQEIQQSTDSRKAGGKMEEAGGVTYKKVWSEQVIDSRSFQEKGYENPTLMQPEGWSDFTNEVTLESFTLGHDLINQLRSFEPYTVHRARLPEGARLEGSVIQYGASETYPDIGDRRVTFQVVPQGAMSVIAMQQGSDLVPWINNRGKAHLEVRTGIHSAGEMLVRVETEFRIMTWIYRGLGWLFMCFGMTTVLAPFAVVGDLIPFLRNVIGGGIKLFSFLTSFILAFALIGIAWMAARPLIGLSIIACALALVTGLGVRSFSAKKRQKQN